MSTSPNRKLHLTLAGGLRVYKVQLVGGPADGQVSLSSHDLVVWNQGDESHYYRRGEDDRYYWDEGATIPALPTHTHRWKCEADLRKHANSPQAGYTIEGDVDLSHTAALDEVIPGILTVLKNEMKTDQMEHLDSIRITIEPAKPKEGSADTPVR